MKVYPFLWIGKQIYFRNVVADRYGFEIYTKKYRKAKTRYNAHIGGAKRKCAFRHMRTAKALIRLRIRAVWTGPSLSADRITGYYRMYKWRITARMMLCACVGWPESGHSAHVRRHVFALRGPYVKVIKECRFPSKMNSTHVNSITQNMLITRTQLCSKSIITAPQIIRVVKCMLLSFWWKRRNLRPSDLVNYFRNKTCQ